MPESPSSRTEARHARAHTVVFSAAFAVALAATVVPLWSTRYLPMVDLPQHLNLINVIGHLHDPSTLYPDMFQIRAGLSPYLGYYWTTYLLSLLFNLLTANALFLTLVAIATPLAVGALAQRLGGQFWMGIMACPFFYGDNFYWGFVAYCFSLPLALFALALALAILDGPARPAGLREIGLALLLVAVQLTHEMAFVYLGLAMPILVLLTPTDWRRRLRVAGAAMPAAVVFTVFWASQVRAHAATLAAAKLHDWLATSAWKSLCFNSPYESLSMLVKLLANGFQDNADRPVVALLAVVVASVLALELSFRWKEPRSWWPPMWGAAGFAVAAALRSGYRSRGERPAVAYMAILAVGVLALILLFGKREERARRRIAARGPALAAAALALFLFLPSDVVGLVALVNGRYAELFALVAIAALPCPTQRGLQRGLALGAMVVSVWYGMTVTKHFRQFDSETREFDSIVAAIGPKPEIIGLIFDTNGSIMSHAAYIHFPQYAAIAHGGVTSVSPGSFGMSALSPVGYKSPPPPAPFLEWQPDLFDYPAYGRPYGYYLVRGRVPAHAVFRGHEAEVQVAAQCGAFTLYTHRP